MASFISPINYKKIPASFNHYTFPGCLKKVGLISLIACSFCMLHYTSNAQQSNSLSKKIETNIQLSNNYLKTDHNQAYKYAKIALETAEKSLAEDKIKGLSNFINILIETGRLPAAHDYLNRLQQISAENNSYSCLYTYYLHSSSALITEGFYKEAKVAIDSSFSIARQYNIKDTGILIYNSAQIDVATLQIKRAITKYENAYRVSNDDVMLMRLCKLNQLPYIGKSSNLTTTVSGLDTVFSNLNRENNLFMLGQTYGMLGNAYLLSFNFPLAKNNFEIADSYFKKIKSPFYQASNLIAWSSIFGMQNKLDSALILIQQSIKIYEALDFKLGLSINHMYASSFYTKLKDTANSRKHRELSGFYNKESKNQIINSNNMLNQANEIKVTDRQAADSIVNSATKKMNIYAKDKTVFIKMPNHKDTIKNSTTLTDLENLAKETNLVGDSITRKRNADALQEFETKYKTRQINDSLQLQNQQVQLNKAEKKRLWISIGALAGLILFIGGGLFILNKQKKKIAKEKKAVENLTGILKHETSRQFGELKTNIVKILKTDQPKQQVSKALTLVKTYEMLYSNLFLSDGLATISLKTAFENIFRYHCDNNSLTITPAFTVSGGENMMINKSDYLFQYMNELMANSFEHAFAGIENPEISISILYQKPVYEITYRDNGIGFPEEKQKIIQGKGMYYIKAYATQNLNGSLELNGKNGTEYKLTFNENNI